MAKRHLLAGIDGGASGCRAAVVALDGTILGRGEAGPANIWTDPKRAAANIRSATGEALKRAGTGRITELHAVLGLAGANIPDAVSKAAPLLPFATCRIETDALISVRGALGDRDGVVAALGTGSVYGCQRSGQIRTIGGWGPGLGDHGSGARLGRMLGEAALLAFDGQVPGSALLRAVVAEAGGPARLVAWADAAMPADFAAFAPRLVAAAQAGDPGAEAVLASADAEVVRAIDTLRDGRDLPVCFVGGLGPVFAARLSERYGGRILEPRGDALDGAVSLALQDLG